MLNDDLFVIIHYPNLFLFRDPYFLQLMQLYPVAQAMTSRIVGKRRFCEKKVGQTKAVIQSDTSTCKNNVCSLYNVALNNYVLLRLGLTVKYSREVD